MTDPDPFLERLERLHDVLGLPEGYAARCPLPLCREPAQLVATEPDFYGRPQQLTPDAFAAWASMKEAAGAEDVTIFLISAFRSLDYQQSLIQSKLQQGRSLEAILEVNAAPGFSEHHTGRAIDIGTPGCDALVEAFESTAAFSWLRENAGSFGFTLSYPRGNPLGIAYEPWHWCFS